MHSFIIKKINLYLISIIISFFSTVLFAETIVIPNIKLDSKNLSHQTVSQFISSTEFTKDEVKKSPAPTLINFLKQEQSVVRLTSNAGDSSQTALSLRGFGDNAVANSLILIDGFPLINPSLLAPNFNSVPLNDIEKIEIFEGSEGTLWGDSAVGGVIALITKHPTHSSFNSIISIGTHRNFFENILISDKADNNIFYKLTGVVGTADNYRKHNEQQTNNVSLQIGKDYSTGTISIKAQTYADKAEFPGGLTYEQFKQHPTLASDHTNFSQYRTQVLQLLNKQELNDKWMLETRLDHHVTNGDGFVYLAFDRKDATTFFNPKLIGNINNNKIIFGLEAQKTSYQLNNSKVDDQDNATQNDIYLQSIIPLLQNIDLILGARGSKQNNTAYTNQIKNNSNQHIFVSEQGLSFKPCNQLTFYIRHDGNFRFPKANEANWLPNNINYLIVQTGHSFEMGSEWKTLDNILKINLYKLLLKNEIAFDPSQTIEHPFGAYQNFDETKREGISISDQYHFTNQFTLGGQINYVNARFMKGDFRNNNIPAVPALNGNLNVEYFLKENWSIQYNLLFTSKRYASDDLANAHQMISSYWLHDLAIQYLTNHVIVSFETDNLFNQTYASYAYYNNFSNDIIYSPAPGRSYFLTLKLNFDS